MSAIKSKMCLWYRALYIYVLVSINKQLNVLDIKSEMYGACARRMVHVESVR